VIEVEILMTNSLILFAASVVFVCCNSVSATSSPIDTKLAAYTDHFADNGPGDAVSVVPPPAGEHCDGITHW
jgi:hypothetical protein